MNIFEANDVVPPVENDNGARLQEPVIIDDRRFIFNVTLFNSNGDVASLKKSSITELSIEDNIFNFFHKGSMMIKNSMDALESFVFPNTNNQVPYKFRGDGRDFLHVQIMPQFFNDIETLKEEGDEDLKRSHMLEFLFVVYDTEDVQKPELNDKYKRLYFWDFTYQRLMEQNTGISSAQVASQILNKDVTQLTNEERAVPTGELIKAILLRANLGKTTFSKNFDSGATNLFYVSPVGNSLLDDLMYVLDRHVSSDANNNDKCILKQERYSKNWSLISLSTYFKNAYEKADASGSEEDPIVLDGSGALHLDKYLLASYEDFSTSVKKELGRESRTPDAAFEFLDNNVLNEYNFNSWSGIDNQQEIVSRIVHYYKFNDKEFNIDMGLNGIDITERVFTENYVKDMKGKNNNPFPSFPLNLVKSENQGTKNVYSVYEDQIQNLSQGRNRTLAKSIFLNNSVNFSTKGMSHRRTARFMSLDRKDSYQDNEFDNKILGIYFITKIVHFFTNDAYTNDVTGVKPYLFRDPQFIKTGA